MDWSAEPWSLGCPTGVLPPGGVVPYGPALRESFGRVHWAGTEMASHWIGYMSGAVEAGEAAAARVLAILRSDRSFMYAEGTR
jgi:monoamine oxidase